MKLLYPALFEPEGDTYNITFPDLPEAITCGSSLDDAVNMAKECLGLCLEVRRENKEEYPKRSDPSTIRCKEGSFLMMIEYDPIEYHKRYHKKAIRKNVTIPSWLNDLAEEKNINFSNVLQNALIKKLNL